MYSRPSTEVSVPPCALRKNTGVPPTPLNARTGLCTPPGDTRAARSKSSRWSAPAERSDDCALDVLVLLKFLQAMAIQSGVDVSLCHRTPNYPPIPSPFAYRAPYVITY